MSKLLILFVIIPLFGAFFCLLEKFLPRIPFAKIASVASILSCMLILGRLYPVVREYGQLSYTVGGWSGLVGIQQHFDGLSWLSFAMTLLIALMAICFAIAENKYEYHFYFFYLMLLAGIAGVVLAADLFNLFVCFEILGIASYLLIAYFQTERALLASLKYLLLSSLGMAFFLLGIFLIYRYTGTLAMFDAGVAAAAAGQSMSWRFTLAVVALIAGIGVRTAFIPFHVWLPEAHAAAPHPVSAMLSGVIIKISFLTIWRLIAAFNLPGLQYLFLWIGAGTAAIAVIWALAQHDCKKLLAWHSISQMGYILAGFGGGQMLSLTAAFAHVLNHALFKSLLFLCIGGVIQATGERHLKRLGNLAGKMPGLALIFVAGAGSISGMPPFNGFISKKLLLASVAHTPVIYALLWITGIGTIASFLKLSAIFRPRVTQFAPTVQNPRQLPRFVYVPLIILALCCVLTGLWGRVLTQQIFFLITGRPHAVNLSFYSLPNILNTGVSFGLGLTLYLLVVSQAGQRIARRIRAAHLGLDMALLFCVLGLLLLAVAAS